LPPGGGYPRPECPPGQPFLVGTRVIGHSGSGAVNLLGAHVSGALGCIEAELRNDSGPALIADSLEVGQDMYLTSEFAATGGGGGARTRLRWPEQWWGSITKVTLGYGYKPWRALWFLAGVLAVSRVLAVMLGVHGALTQTSKT